MTTPDRAPDTGAATRPKREQKRRILPPYNVVLENDDYHSFSFVVEVLCKVLGCSLSRAYSLTLQAHLTGRAVVWTGPKEVAELKKEQIQSYHEVRSGDQRKLGPLGCFIEPAP
ncbi:MAG: ATP-dependent Clp protease adaptor ClpS [Gemmataceae bacterium]|nr:ATP-dependent Clp protease adaptor ClpS [Gemmataceae bacterium]MDW8264292.1 ATP-dependent Clp protease adaptor ClpS [Gemmataceae bacterium]